MCQSNLYAIDNGREELVLKEVARLKIKGDQLTIAPLLGAPISLAARVKEIDLMNHRIVVEKI